MCCATVEASTILRGLRGDLNSRRESTVRDAYRRLVSERAVNTDSRPIAARPQHEKGTSPQHETRAIPQHIKEGRGVVCNEDDSIGALERRQRRKDQRADDYVVTLDEFLEHYRCGGIPGEGGGKIGNQSRPKPKTNLRVNLI